MAETERGNRPIRSYVKRQGRLTPAQGRALSQLWPLYGIEHETKLLEFDQRFDQTNPVHLEIGFGNGDAILHAALQAPDQNFLGVEVHRPGVGHLLLGIAEHELSNLRIICHDAVDVLNQQVADHALASIRVYFPDPWHKKRHHKRRLIQPDFAALMARKIQAGGFMHLATDWQAYARHMLAVMDDQPRFENQAGAGCFSPRPGWRPETRFELRGKRLGHAVWDLLYSRREENAG